MLLGKSILKFSVEAQIGLRLSWSLLIWVWVVWIHETSQKPATPYTANNFTELN